MSPPLNWSIIGETGHGEVRADAKGSAGVANALPCLGLIRIITGGSG
ncbi:hypothetical protein JXA88_12070 [Candidatus Fermentibacteria bacterium]|nr:hypothetical protein [Candidatus Fermentibacteria bacterium]